MAKGGVAEEAPLLDLHFVEGGVVLGGFILGLIVMIFGIILARIQYKNYTFAFEEFDMKVKRGWLSTRIMSIPYRQMQDVNLERDLTHRLTKTTRVVIASAGTDESPNKDEADIILDPIDMAAADEIRLMLERKIGVQVVQGEKEADQQAGMTGDNSVV